HDTRIAALFSADADLDLLQHDLLRSLGLKNLPAHAILALPDRDWQREWWKDFQPMRFGKRLWICPGDSTAEVKDAVTVRLDPGLAFGTGTHATTALCLDWLDGLLLRHKTILDYGCGSGVLAIAALLLGCDSAAAMDIDAQAITATESNARRNNVAKRLSLHSDAASIAGSFDVVVANILADPLITHAKTIATHVRHGGLLALSGLLSGQVDEVMRAYQPWIEFEQPAFRDQDGQSWARLSGRRIEG
ncbi:MAG: 50S ribosomal protein L11 methyltransferase, partial [Gammaproteobacteria bacterium]|nr:50S ribosomal protein L11 methyltransferase [Gammaproteobacteria bacterium]